jgi:hypothetical protein
MAEDMDESIQLCATCKQRIQYRGPAEKAWYSELCKNNDQEASNKEET